MTTPSTSFSDRREALVDGEFAFTGADFKRIAALLYEQAGISLPDSKATLVYSRLAKRLRTLGLKSFAEYCAFVQVADDRVRSLFDELHDIVTTPNLTNSVTNPDTGRADVSTAGVGTAAHG
jgi:hypothetical protein